MFHLNVSSFSQKESHSKSAIEGLHPTMSAALGIAKWLHFPKPPRTVHDSHPNFLDSCVCVCASHASVFETINYLILLVIQTYNIEFVYPNTGIHGVYTRTL